MGMLCSVTGGIDFSGPSPSLLTFRPGQTVGDQLCTVVSILDDAFIEEEEIFYISLSVAPEDMNLVKFHGGSLSTVTIIQDPNDSTQKLCLLFIVT